MTYIQLTVHHLCDKHGREKTAKITMRFGAHRHEYTCIEQVTAHIKQIRTEQFTDRDRVRVLREEPLQTE